MNILVLDTETIGGTDPRIYNIGWVICDTETGRIVKARDYVIREIFEDDALMSHAYYANKRPLYDQRIKDGACKAVYWNYACFRLAFDIALFRVAELYAYNSRFDMRTIASTCKQFGTSDNPAPYIDDIMDYVDVITDTPEYQEFCRSNGFLTKHKTPRCQTKAETLYRFLTQNPGYIEEHTALADSRIELHILAEAWRCGA